MKTSSENALLIQLIASHVEELKNVLGDSWPPYLELLAMTQQRLVSAVDGAEIDEEIDAVLEALLASPAAEVIRQILRDAREQSGAQGPALRSMADQTVRSELVELSPTALMLGARLQPREYEHFVTIPVFYATDRARSTNGYYGGERGDLQYGIAEVSIPEAHVTGKIERPRWWTLQRSEDPQRYVTVLSCRSLDSNLFTAEISKLLSASTDASLMIFVHGYNVAFVEALRQTAQIAYDLNLPGIPFLYSWPSKGKYLSYTVDENNVTWTREHFREVLLLLTDLSGSNMLDVVTHSMGSRAFLDVSTSFNGMLHNGSAVLRNLVFAAPDVDSEVFRSQLLKLAVEWQRVTLYASSRDRALQASKLVHGYPRAGESGDAMVIIPDLIDTIDATAVSTSLLGHSYIGDNRSILTDIFTLINIGTPPPRFGMSQRQSKQLHYWFFRP